MNWKSNRTRGNTVKPKSNPIAHESTNSIRDKRNPSNRLVMRRSNSIFQKRTTRNRNQNTQRNAVKPKGEKTNLFGETLLARTRIGQPGARETKSRPKNQRCHAAHDQRTNEWCEKEAMAVAGQRQFLFSVKSLRQLRLIHWSTIVTKTDFFLKIHLHFALKAFFFSTRNED